MYKKVQCTCKVVVLLIPSFFSRFGPPSTCVRRVNTVIENASSQKRSPVEISENAVLLYSCGWVKHESTSSFENDNVTMSVTSKCACSHHWWYRFQSLLRLWTGKTIEKRNEWTRTWKMDTCGRSVRSLPSEPVIKSKSVAFLAYPWRSRTC